MPAKVRLDQLMVTQGLAETRSKAQALILAGSVRIKDAVVDKPGTLVAADAVLTLAEKLPYVSRGGYKLAHALDTFQLNPAGLVALDVGASTGGFTDVLLQRGAAHVYAVDVGYGQLDYRLQIDPRVTVLDRTNIRHLERLPPRLASTGSANDTPNPASAAPERAPASAAPEPRSGAAPERAPASAAPEPRSGAASERAPASAAPEPRSGAAPHCAVIDASFISLRLILPPVQRLIAADAWVVALVKPQFEAGAAQVGRGGVVRDPAVHRAVVLAVLREAAELGLTPHAVTRSPITGPAGNVEFLVWIGGPGPLLDLTALPTL